MTITNIIADFKSDIATLEAAIAPTKGCTTVEGQSWIVLDPYGQAIKFETTRNGKRTRATVTGKTLPHRANRWGKSAAQQIADQLGDCTIANWKDATAVKLLEMRDLVKQFEQGIAYTTRRKI